jgi:hypothetical protein
MSGMVCARCGVEVLPEFAYTHRCFGRGGGPLGWDSATALRAALTRAAARTSRTTAHSPEEILPVLRRLVHRGIPGRAWDRIVLGCAECSAERGISLAAAAEAILPILDVDALLQELSEERA